MAIGYERWEVTPLASPRLIRHCAACNAARPFVCADSFRVNAQKKALDVWLNYRCERCASVWKLPLLERQPVGNVAAGQLEAFFRDDPLVAQQFAFDIGQLRKHGRVDAVSEVSVRRVAILPAADPVRCLCVTFHVPLPCTARLDRLLAHQLGVSRTSLSKLHTSGELWVSPDRPKPLRAPVQNDQRVWIAVLRLRE